MTHVPGSPLDVFVEALVALGGPLTSIVEHMARAQAAGLSAPDAPSIPEVLTAMLRGVLDPLRDEFSADEIETATEFVVRTCDRIVEEVLLVEPED